MSVHAEIDKRFGPWPAAAEDGDPHEAEARNDMREHARRILGDAAHALADIVPKGRDRLMMLTHLEYAYMRALRGVDLAAGPLLAGHGQAVEGDTPPDAGSSTAGRAGGMLAP